MLTRCGNALLRLAKRIGHIQVWIILTLFYAFVVTPIALIFKLVADPLHLRRGVASIWTVPSEPADRLAWAKVQA